MVMAHQHHLRRRRLVTASAISRCGCHDWSVRPPLSVRRALSEVKQVIAVLDGAMPVIEHCLSRGSPPPDPWDLCNYAQVFAQRLREASEHRAAWVTALVQRRADLLDEAADRLWIAMVRRED